MPYSSHQQSVAEPASKRQALVVAILVASVSEFSLASTAVAQPAPAAQTETPLEAAPAFSAASIEPGAGTELDDGAVVRLKSDLLDRRLRFNISTFYYKYTNQQVSVTQRQPTQSFTTNAAGSRLYGVDIDTVARVTSRFQVGFAASILNAKHTGIPNANIFVSRAVTPYNNSGVVANYSGNYLSKAPNFMSALAADWTIPLSAGSLSFNGAWAYNSGFYWEPSNPLYEGAHHLFNGKIYYQFPGEKLKFPLWGKDLSNKQYYSYQTATWAGDQGAPAAPRTFGVAIDMQT